MCEEFVRLSLDLLQHHLENSEAMEIFNYYRIHDRKQAKHFPLNFESTTGT